DDVAAAVGDCRVWSPCPEFLELTGDHGAAGDSCVSTCFPSNGSLACGGELTVPAVVNAKTCDVGDGLYCHPDHATCEARVALGQPCADTYACAGSWCDRDAGTCAPYLAEGTDCTEQAAGCGEGLVCTSPDGVCSSIVAAHTGAKCTCAKTKP